MSYYLIIRGPLGVGKSTIAQALSSRLDAQLVSIDSILAQQGLEAAAMSWETGDVSERAFILANEVAAAEASGLLRNGTPVVFDGNFYWKSQVHDLLERLRFPNSVFTLRAPLEVCVQRDAGRSVPHGRKGAEEVFRKSTEFDFGVVIDATRPLDAILEDILLGLPPRRRR